MKHYNDLGFFDFEDFDEERIVTMQVLISQVKNKLCGKIVKSKICLIFLIISLLISCKSNKYERLIENVNDYKMIQKMDDAKNALELLDKAIKMEPNRWDAYSKKIQIYNFWEHIPYDFKENQEGIKSVFEQW